MEVTARFGGVRMLLSASDTQRLNMSIGADPQQQEAASPQMLVVRSFLRYPS